MSASFAVAILLVLVFTNPAYPASSPQNADNDIDHVDTLPSNSGTDNSINQKSNSRGLSNRVSWAASRAMKILTLLLLGTSGLDAAHSTHAQSIGTNANSLNFLSAGLPPNFDGESDSFDFRKKHFESDDTIFGTEYIDVPPKKQVHWKDSEVGEHFKKYQSFKLGDDDIQEDVDTQHSQANRGAGTNQNPPEEQVHWKNSEFGENFKKYQSFKLSDRQDVNAQHSQATRGAGTNQNLNNDKETSMGEEHESSIPSSQTVTPGRSEDPDKSNLRLTPSISGFRRLFASSTSLLGGAYSLFFAIGRFAQSICSVWQLVWVSLSLTVVLAIFFPSPFLFSIGSFAIGVISSLVSFPFILSRRSLLFFWLSFVFAASGMMRLLAASLKKFSLKNVKVNAPELLSPVKSLSAPQPSPAPIIKPDVPFSLPGWFMKTREGTLALVVATLVLLWLLIALTFYFFSHRRKAMLECPSEQRHLSMENDSVVHISLSEPSNVHAGPQEPGSASRPRSASM